MILYNIDKIRLCLCKVLLKNAKAFYNNQKDLFRQSVGRQKQDWSDKDTRSKIGVFFKKKYASAINGNNQNTREPSSHRKIPGPGRKKNVQENRPGSARRHSGGWGYQLQDPSGDLCYGSQCDDLGRRVDEPGQCFDYTANRRKNEKNKNKRTPFRKVSAYFLYKSHSAFLGQIFLHRHHAGMNR